MLLPWKPELIFTGTSVMGINPETGKFCSHVVQFQISSDKMEKLCGLLEISATCVFHFVGFMGFHQE